MRIYLACTVRGSQSGAAATRLIAERLTALGHEILTGHLLDPDVEHNESRLSEADVFERDVRWLDQCEALVAEASGSSYGVGFEVGYILGRAAHTGQRAWVLYDRSRQSAISRLVLGNSHPCCRTLAYGSLEEVAAFVEAEFARDRVGSSRPTGA